MRVGIDTSSKLPLTTPHLNLHGLSIQSSPTDGRGVYASSPISRGVVIEISPVLIFNKEEYTAHGRHTILDSYTFIWKDKRKGGEKSYALALGLGSLFNHSSTPNVSYTLDYETMSIRYTTSQPVKAGEQLFISYGREEDLWWNTSHSTALPSDTLEDNPLLPIFGFVEDL